MTHIKYKKPKRLNNKSTKGIHKGRVHVFPKIDGTNANIWLDEKEGLQAGGRNVILSVQSNNRGFYLYVMSRKEMFNEIFTKHPNIRLFGEWLVSHTIKNYQDTAWNQFYLFDVYDEEKEKYLTYDEYSVMLKDYELNIIEPILVCNDPTDEQLEEASRNTYLMKEGFIGEGVVIKNYDFIQSFKNNETGNVVNVVEYGKIVNDDVMTNNKKKKQEVDTNSVYDMLLDDTMLLSLSNKTFNKIKTENNNVFLPQHIGRLVKDVFDDVITDKLPPLLQGMKKKPTIDFSKVQQHIGGFIREEMKEQLFESLK